MRKLLCGLLVCMLVLSLCACAIPQRAIVGTWKCQTTVLGVVTETRYTFNPDGTGTKSMLLDMGFTYEFSEGKLMITSSGLSGEKTETYLYKFKGKTLILTGENTTLTLEKVN